MKNPFYEYNKFIESNPSAILKNHENFIKAMRLSPTNKQINDWKEFLSKADKIRKDLIGCKDILFLDNADLILWYYGYLN